MSGKLIFNGWCCLCVWLIDWVIDRVDIWRSIENTGSAIGITSVFEESWTSIMTRLVKMSQCSKKNHTHTKLFTCHIKLLHLSITKRLTKINRRNIFFFSLNATWLHNNKNINTQWNKKLWSLQFLTNIFPFVKTDENFDVKGIYISNKKKSCCSTKPPLANVLVLNELIINC